MIYAILPVKPLETAKARLAGVLSVAERRALVLAMLEDVLNALQQTKQLTGIGVISRDPRVLSLATQLGVDALLDRTTDLNAALTSAAQHYRATGASAILAVPADVPLATHCDFAALLRRAPAERGAVIAPSRDGGTSALLMRPPLAMEYCFGPQSLVAHEAAARRAGIPIKRCYLPRLAADVDQPDDLLRLASHWSSAAGQLSHELQITERMAWV